MPKNSVEENPLVFHYFRVPKKFLLQWVMSRLSISCRIFFCLTVPKCFVVEPLCAVFQRISDIDKLHGQEGGSRFLVEVFCLTVPKVSVGENLYCFTMVGYRKSLDKRGGGGIKIFRRKFFPS